MQMTYLQKLPDHHRFEQGSKATGGNDVRVGHKHEVVQPGEERRVLEGLLDERVHVLFERQVHPDADALRPLVCLRRPRPFVGGLHQTRAAPGNDVAPPRTLAHVRVPII